MSPSAQSLLSLLALVIIGLLAGALVVHAVPPENKELVTFALGALSGALTVGGAGRPPAASAKDAPEPSSPQS